MVGHGCGYRVEDATLLTFSKQCSVYVSAVLEYYVAHLGNVGRYVELKRDMSQVPIN